VGGGGGWGGGVGGGREKTGKEGLPSWKLRGGSPGARMSRGGAKKQIDQS